MLNNRNNRNKQDLRKISKTSDVDHRFYQDHTRSHYRPPVLYLRRIPTKVGVIFVGIPFYEFVSIISSGERRRPAAASDLFIQPEYHYITFRLKKFAGVVTNACDIFHSLQVQFFLGQSRLI